MTAGSKSVPPASRFQAVAGALARHQSDLTAALAGLVGEAEVLAEIAALIEQTLRAGNKVLLAGNGGSAAEAQHFAAELVGRFKRERAPYAALALTTDTSILTAIANDYEYAEVFSRQVIALGQSGDLLIGFSTSGESENLIRAAAAAHARQMSVIAVTGAEPSRLERAADLALRAPSSDTAIVQELHTVVTHLLCGLIESELG